MHHSILNCHTNVSQCPTFFFNFHIFSWLPVLRNFSNQNLCSGYAFSDLKMPSLLEAINSKYGIYGDEIYDHTPVAIYVPKRSPRKYIPSLLVLNDCDIDSAGHELDLKEKCKTVEDLDLAQNNLSQWTEVMILRCNSNFFFLLSFFFYT